MPEPESAQTATFLKTAGWPAFAFAMFVLGVVFGMAIQKERSQSMEQAMEEAMRRQVIPAIQPLLASVAKERVFRCADDLRSRPRYNGDPPTSISVGPLDIVLIQGDGKLGAFRITKDGYWEPTASYEFWYLGESVQIVQPVPLKSASVQLDESTNTLKIKVGPLEAEWSSGNHIFPTAGAKISATPWNDVADVDLSSAELKWIGRSR